MNRALKTAIPLFLASICLSSCVLIGENRHPFPFVAGNYSLGEKGVYLFDTSEERTDLFDSIDLKIEAITESEFNELDDINCVMDLSTGNTYYSIILSLAIKDDEEKTIELTYLDQSEVINGGYIFLAHDSYVAGKEAYDFQVGIDFYFYHEDGDIPLSFANGETDEEIFSFHANLSSVDESV